MLRVSELHHYPVKSFRGQSSQSLELDQLGALNDRRFMVVDEEGLFVTQRGEPRLATFSADVTAGLLRISGPDGDLQEVRLDAPGPFRRVTVWKHTVEAIDCGDAAAHFLQSRLGRKVRLVRGAASMRRAINPEYDPRPETLIAFADAYPLLIVNTASLDDFNRGRSLSLEMNRFRPNVVIETDTPWAEDEWKTIQVGEVVFDLVKPCSRCAVITTDQQTGHRPEGAAPLNELIASRTLKPIGAIFGQNAAHRTLGTLRVGDRVVVLERQPKPQFSA